MNPKLGVVMKNLYKRVEGPKTWSSNNVTNGHMTHVVYIQRVEGPQKRVNNNQRDGRTRDSHIHYHYMYIDSSRHTLVILKELLNHLCIH